MAAEIAFVFRLIDWIKTILGILELFWDFFFLRLIGWIRALGAAKPGHVFLEGLSSTLMP